MGMSLEALKPLLRETAAKAIQAGKDIHVLLREHLPVYPV